MILYLSGKLSLQPGKTTWKYTPHLLKEPQTLVLSLTTRHLFMLEWKDDALLLPVETTLTGNETRLLQAIWNACPDVCDRIDVMRTLRMEREIVWRTISTLRKKLRHVGVNVTVCEQGYLLVRSREKGEGSG